MIRRIPSPMAKVSLNRALTELYGGFDGTMFRRIYGKIVVSPKPDRSRHTPSPKEAAQIERFRRAALRAKGATPEMRLRYQERARAENKPAYAIRVRDYIHPPVIESINLAGYSGLPGDCILVRAHDDFEVRDVTVTIRLPNGAVVESGRAQRSADDGELFYYATTSAPATGSEVIVEAAATDWPGNRTTRQIAWMTSRR